jgi:site-specific DNA recombinase
VTDEAAIYGRVSTGSQAESLETQLARLRAAAPGATAYIDSGISGRGVDRPAFDRLLVEVLARRVDSVTVTKLDRLERSARAILEFFSPNFPRS